MRMLWKLHSFLPPGHFCWDIRIMKLRKELVFSELCGKNVFLLQSEKEGVIIMPMKPLISLDKENMFSDSVSLWP